MVGSAHPTLYRFRFSVSDNKLRLVNEFQVGFGGFEREHGITHGFTRHELGNEVEYAPLKKGRGVIIHAPT